MLGWLLNLGFAASASEALVEDVGPRQALRQASYRAIGGTVSTYSGDAMAAMAAELEAAEIAVPATFNGRQIAWLQLRTGSSSNNINMLMQQFAEDNGAYNWSSMGTFDPADQGEMMMMGGGEMEMMEAIAAVPLPPEEEVTTLTWMGRARMTVRRAVDRFRSWFSEAA